MAYSLVLNKENFKFSASHFTIFSEKNAEALHGHNYNVGVKLAFNELDKDLEMKIDFKHIKEKIKAICDALDEKILIPKGSKFLKISPSPHYKRHTQVEYGDRFYCFPDNEILQLPLSNITTEALARYIWENLEPHFKKDFHTFSVNVKETAGQSAIYMK